METAKKKKMMILVVALRIFSCLAPAGSSSWAYTGRTTCA